MKKRVMVVCVCVLAALAAVGIVIGIVVGKPKDDYKDDGEIVCSFLTEDEMKYYYSNCTVEIGSDEWYNLDFSSMLAMLKVDREKIQKSSTNDLMRIFMANPFLGDVMLYDNFSLAHSTFKDRFEVYKELVSRERFAEVLSAWTEFSKEWEDNSSMFARKKAIEMMNFVADYKLY